MYSEEMDSNDEVEETSNNGGNFVKLIICGILLVIIVVLVIILLKNKKNNNDNTSENYIVKIIPDSAITVNVNDTYYLTASVSADDGKIVPNPNIRWSVEKSEIISVDNGTIKALDYGQSKVTAVFVSSDGKIFQDSKLITVAGGDSNIPVENITIPDGDLYLPLNGSYQIEYTLVPPNGYVESKSFISSNPRVVTVDNNGLIKAISLGEASITLSINNGAITKNLNIVVSDDVIDPAIVAYPTSITIDNSITNMKVGETLSLKYTLVPTNSKTDKLVWTSSNPEVLNVDQNGLVKANSSGVAKITLSSLNNVNNSIDITVTSSEIQKIDFNQMEIIVDANNQASMTITIGYPVTITPVITPADANNPMLDFIQTNPTIVNVVKDPTGKKATVEGLTEGSTELAIRSTNNISNKILITVVKPSDGGSDGGGSGGSVTYRCYCNSSGSCQWSSSKKGDYIDIQSRIPNSTACSIYSNNHKQACFKDSRGNYQWGNYGTSSGYTYVPGISTRANCKEGTAVTESLNCSSTYKNQTGQCTLNSTNNMSIKSAKIANENVAKVVGYSGNRVSFNCINDNTNKQTSSTVTVTTSSGRTVSSSIVCKPLSSISLICPATVAKGAKATCTVSGLDSASQLESCSSNKGSATKDGKTCVVTYDNVGTVTVTAKTTLGQSVSKNITYQNGIKTMSISCPSAVTISGTRTTTTCSITTDATNVKCVSLTTGVSASYSGGRCTITYSGATSKTATIKFSSSDTADYTRTINFTGKTIKTVTLTCPTQANGVAKCTVSNPNNAPIKAQVAGTSSFSHNGSTITINYSGSQANIQCRVCSTDDNIAITSSGEKCITKTIAFNVAASGCSAGYWRGQNGCEKCSANSYCPDGVKKIACPANSTSVAGSSTCKCNTGYKMVNNKCEKIS